MIYFLRLKFNKSCRSGLSYLEVTTKGLRGGSGKQSPIFQVSCHNNFK